MRNNVEHRFQLSTINNSAYFSSSDAEFPHSDTYNVSTAIACSAWIRTKCNNCIIAKKYVVVSPYHGLALGVGFSVPAGKLGFKTYSSIWTPSQKIINDGRWHFIFGQHRVDGKKQIYIDGILDYETTQTFDVNNLSNIGFNRLGSYQYRGFLSFFRMYADNFFNQHDINHIMHTNEKHKSCVCSIPFDTSLLYEEHNNVGLFNTATLKGITPPLAGTRDVAITRNYRQAA